MRPAERSRARQRYQEDATVDIAGAQRALGGVPGAADRAARGSWGERAPRPQPQSAAPGGRAQRHARAEGLAKPNIVPESGETRGRSPVAPKLVQAARRDDDA